ncbi:exported hypothetical protein [Burkholderiales bacterium]|jgi:hypothetical protein|nr:exported hypothetical protein [Burkholderiales bacterium]
MRGMKCAASASSLAARVETFLLAAVAFSGFREPALSDRMILLRCRQSSWLRRRIAAGCGGGIMKSADEDSDIPDDAEEIRRRITELEIEHRDLDQAIVQMSERACRDELQLRRLKKRKLLIKDSITRLEMGLVPDIPA